MNTNASLRCGRRGGYALVLVLVFSAIGLTVLTGTMNWASQTALMNERNNQLNATTYAAEASTERIVSRLMADYKASGESVVFNNLTSYRTNVPASGENAYWSAFQFSNGSGTTNQNYVARTQTQVYTNIGGPYTGLLGFVSNYRVLSNARQTTGRFNLTNAVQQDLQLASIPVFQFAIFYNMDLEVNSQTAMEVRGRVHSNGRIYTGPSSALTFFDPVSSVGQNFFSRMPGDPAYSGSPPSGTVTYSSTQTTNASALTLPIGTNNSSSAVREVLNIPPSAESMASPMGQQRYFNKSELQILVSNSTVTVRVKTPFDATPSTINWTNASYFIATNLTFTDQREGKTVRTTEIDVTKFRAWAATNTTVISKLGAGNPPNLVYVSDDRTVTASQVTGVRLINGQTLPTRGLTVATPNPLYVKGHYNCPTNAHLGTTNTTATKPASLASDALTVLSGSWSDALSSGSYSTRNATDTTINAAVLTGIVRTTNSPARYSGGVQNIGRFLEAWSGDTITYNGSMVVLYDSTRATAPFQQPGAYYSAPARELYFDNNFSDVTKQPPGTPELRALIRGSWASAPPNRTNYVASF